MNAIQNMSQRVLSSELFWSGLALLLMAGAGLVISAGLLVVPVPLVVIGLLALFGCVVILCRPYLGIILFLGLMYLRLEQFVPKIASLRLPLLLSCFTLFAWTVQFLLKKETFRWHPTMGWVGAFTIAWVLSTLKVPEPELTLTAIQEAAKIFLLFMLLHQLLNTERRAHQLLQWLLVFTVCLAFYGIQSWMSGTALHENGKIRAMIHVGMFDDPNDLAAALVIPVPVALLLIFRARSKAAKLWGTFALAALLAGIYTCNSRGGMLALGVSVGVFMVYQLGWTRGCMIGAVAVLALFLFGPDRFSTKSLKNDDSAMGRIMAWRAGLQMLEKNPALGVGYTQFDHVHEITAHNSFVLGMGEGGVATSMAWVGMNYWAMLTLVRLRRKARKHPEGAIWGGYVAALQAGLMGSLSAGWFLSHTYRAIPIIPLAVAAALGGMAYANSGEKPEERPSDLIHYFGVPVVWAVLVGLVYLSSGIRL